jgi:YVTN family beta-propeller protein
MRRYSGYFGITGFLFVLVALPLAASTVRVWVMNQDQGTIGVINPLTNKVEQTIEGIAKPYGAVFSPDGSRAYVVDEGPKHALDVVDTRTGKVIKEVQLSGRRPSLPAITKDGGRVLVCIKAAKGEQGAVDIVNTSSLEVKTIPMEGAMHDIQTTADGKYAIAGTSDEGFKQPSYPLSVIDLQTEQPVWQVRFETGVLTFDIENGPDGSPRRIFVDLADFNGFVVVDFATRKEVSRIKLPDVDKGFSFEDSPNPAHGTGVAPNGKTLWECSRWSNYVYVFSLTDLKLLGRVYMPELKVVGHPVEGGDPHWVTFTPDGRTVYVTNAHAKIVSAVDATTLKEVARIPVGDNARRIFTVVMP